MSLGTRPLLTKDHFKDKVIDLKDENTLLKKKLKENEETTKKYSLSPNKDSPRKYQRTQLSKEVL
jgi:hypothetical protein